jgi:hypothetical protein
MQKLDFEEEQPEIKPSNYYTSNLSPNLSPILDYEESPKFCRGLPTPTGNKLINYEEFENYNMNSYSKSSLRRDLLHELL